MTSPIISPTESGPISSLPYNPFLGPQATQVDAVWLDINTLMGLNGKTDLVPNVQAINNSLFNLLMCPIGARGRIGQPEYGTLIYVYLQEPMDYITANKIKINFIQAIQRWETRINIDMNRSNVTPNFALPGYYVQVYYSIVDSQQLGIASFFIKK